MNKFNQDKYNMIKAISQEIKNDKSPKRKNKKIKVTYEYKEKTAFNFY
jgi:hypothetical protein